MNRIPVILLALALAAYWAWVGPLTYDGDIYLHLKTGELITHGTFPFQDVFGYPAAGTATEIHSWLGQVLLSLAGNLRVVLFVALAWVLVGVAWLTGFSRASAFIVLLTYFLHTEMIDLRPQLFGEMMLIATLLMRARNPQPWVYLILAAVWANLHGSAVLILPLALFQGPKPFLFALGGLFFQPSGWFFLENATLLSQAGSSLKVAEWAHGSFFNFQGASVVLALVPSTAIFLIALFVLGLTYNTVPFRKRTEAAFWIALAALFVRNRIYLFLPLIWLLPVALERIRQPVAAVGLAGLTLLAFTVQAKSDFVLPEKAVGFIKEVGLRGNVFNEATWGGYLLHEAYPHIKVALDARVTTHQKLLAQLVASEKRDGTVNLKPIVDNLPETDIIVHRSSVPLASLFNEGWVVVFDNPTATILVRTNERNAENLQKVAGYYAAQAISFNPEVGIRYRHARNESLEREGPPLAQAEFLFSRGLTAVAIDRLREALEKDPFDPKLALRLGAYLVASGRFVEAKVWLDQMERVGVPARDLVPLRVALREWDLRQGS